MSEQWIIKESLKEDFYNAKLVNTEDIVFDTSFRAF